MGNPLIVNKQDYFKFTCNTLNASFRHHLIINGRSQGYNKSKKNHYPIGHAEIVGDDRSVSKLAHIVNVAAMTGSA